MGRVNLFTIYLQKQNAIYCPGETVAGNLVLRVNERFKINLVSILVQGYAKTFWTEQRVNCPNRPHQVAHGPGPNTHTVHYGAYENYFKSYIILLSNEGSSDLYLEAGEYNYPFQVVLPPNLPSSFEHYFGKIRYTVKGTIDIPWAIDKHTEKSFTVLSGINLNNLGPSIRQPVEKQDSKSILFSFGGPIIANFRLEKTGYVPGETVRYQASINNTSNRDVIRTRIRLVQYARFQGTSRELIVQTNHMKISEHDVAKIIIDKQIVGKTSQSVIADQPFVIPSVCSTLNNVCRIISVNYSLVFTFGVRGSIDKDLIIPITIGTVPLQTRSDTYLPPPTYEQSMLGNNLEKQEFKEDGQSTKGDIYDSDADTYKPLYPNFIGFNQFES